METRTRERRAATDAAVATVDDVYETLMARGFDETLATDETITLYKAEVDRGTTAGNAAGGLPDGHRSLGPAHVSLAALPALSIDKSGAVSETGEPGAEVTADLSVVDVLGEGGMGRVELARQHSLRREVALKTVRDAERASAVDALLREALFTGFLEHPNIVPVHQLGRLEEGPVLVMKRVEGVSWRELIADPEHPHWDHLPGDRIARHVEIVMQVCNAVHFANTHDVVHRDIKPENVMVGEFGEVYLMDWGVALDLAAPEARASRALVGTPAYMAPEMLDGASEVGPSTDIYLLAASLFEALTGETPHRGDGIHQVLLAAYTCDPAALDYPDDVPDELVEILTRCLQRDPDARPGSARTLRDELTSFLRHRGSVETSERAQRQMEEALELLDDEPERGLRELNEAHFGFQQALREWEDNDEARRGLQACLEILIEHELDARNRGLASQLYEELPEPVPALRERLDALSSELERDAHMREAYVQLKRDVDVNYQSGRRAIFLLVIATLFSGFLATVAMLEKTGVIELDHAHMTLGPAFATLLLTGVIFAARKFMLTNRINRQLGLVLVLFPAAVTLNRAVSWALDAEFSHIVAQDLVVATAIVCVAAIIDSRLWITIPTTLLSPFAAILFPEWGLLIEAIVIFFIGFDIAWIWRRSPECLTPGDADEAREAIATDAASSGQIEARG